MNLQRIMELGHQRDVYRTVSFDLRSSEREKLRAICAELDCSQANLLRGIIADFLENYRGVQHEEG